MTATSPLVVAVAQPRCVVGDVAANVAEHARAVRSSKARVVVFPELSLTGYELDAPAVDPGHPVLEELVDACRETGALALPGAPVVEAGSRFIATLAATGEGVTVAYRKMSLGGDEPGAFAAGREPVALDVDGWRLGLAICKDTGTPAHIDATAALGIDLYVAGLVHRTDELTEQDARAAHIVERTGAGVAFASAGGRAGHAYPSTAGHSTVWSPDGTVLARAGVSPGEVVTAAFTPGGRHPATALVDRDPLGA